jgi:hypothetical protein
MVARTLGPGLISRRMDYIKWLTRYWLVATTYSYIVPGV